jgi:energy-coupling factor transporter transmembrane protein EcfT
MGIPPWVYLLMLVTALVLFYGFGWDLRLAAVVSVFGWAAVGWILTLFIDGEPSKEHNRNEPE